MRFLLLSFAFLSHAAFAMPTLDDKFHGQVVQLSCSDGASVNIQEVPSYLQPGASISGAFILNLAGAHIFSRLDGNPLKTSWSPARLHGRRPCRDEYLFVTVLPKPERL